MKNKLYKFLQYSSLTTLLLVQTSCKDFLKEEVFSQYDPNQFLQNKSGVDALLTGAYAAMAVTNYAMRDNYFVLNEFTTDMTLESGGGLERQVVPFMQFNWGPGSDFINGQYNQFYNAIARANSVLLVTSTLNGVNEETINQINAEAKFIRSFAYFMLHNIFGPTPIIDIPAGASLDEIEKIGKETPKATEEQYRKYVEDDLLFATKILKTSNLSSRANLGNSWAMLTKFYLNNKEWQKASNAASEVLKLDYQLYSDYTKLFAVEGENNKEHIFRFECLATSSSPQVNVYMPHAFPPSYPILSTWSNFGAQFRTFTAFYEKFDAADERKKLFIESYTPIGKTVPTLLSRSATGVALDDIRSFKYVPDPAGVADRFGNDIPYIRLADIILSKAEAINELSGPTQEAIDLINRVRTRAKIAPITLANYSTKDKLRDFILEERGKEFYSEGKRREDLVRHNKFISQAIERKIAAKPHQVLYPFPQAQIDNNPNLKQNEGY